MKALDAAVEGRVLFPGDEGYDEARRVFNAMIDRRPAAIVRCAGDGDVVAAVNHAREHDLPLSVKGGGHSFAGTAVCHGGIMVDLSPMKGLRVDPAASVAQAEPGLTLGEFDAGTQAHGLATTTGVVSMTGLTTPKLHRLHAVSVVLGGGVMFPPAQARDALRFYHDFARAAPYELSTAASVSVDGDGRPVVSVAVCWCGPTEEGEKVVRPLRSFGPPTFDGIAPMGFTALQSGADAGYPPGRLHYWKARASCGRSPTTPSTSSSTSPPTCHRPSPASACRSSAARPARVAPTATAFPHRDHL
jgi:hypothetical protein